MRRIGPPLLALGLAWLLPQAGRAQNADIASRWHITVIEHDLTARIVPLVATPQRPVTMQDLSSANGPACRQAATQALAAYPDTLVASLVQTLALADQITAWNIRIGGFHALGLIALNCDDAAENQAFDRDSLHDELAALLLAKTPINAQAWDALNPPGFHYGDTASYRAELRDPHGRAGDDALHRNGFVSALGLTGRDNDVQTYAERIFGHPADFAAMLRSQPAMRGKARMVMALYLAQAPQLAAQFTAVGLTEAVK